MYTPLIHSLRMKALPLKHAPTLFLKAVIVFLGALVGLLCVFLFPMLWRELAHEPQLGSVVYPGLIGLYLTPLPFFFALVQAFKLLQYIDTNTAFSDFSVQALKNIKYSAVAISMCYAAGMPLVFVFANLDDAPGAVLMGAAITCAPLIVATFAAVLEKLIRSAIDLKSENDLTI